MLSTKTPNSFPTELLFSQPVLSLNHCQGFFLTRSLWIVALRLNRPATPLSLVSSANSTRMSFVTSSRCLIKMLNTSQGRILWYSSWYWSPGRVWPLDSYLLSPVIQPFFFTYLVVCLLRSYHFNLDTSIRAEFLAKVEVNDIHCSSLTHRSGHLIIKDNQIC